MPTTEIKKDGAQVTLTITVTPDELFPFLENAAKEISREKTIRGFRPGSAPYNEVAKEFREMTILEAALNSIVRKTFVKAVKDHQLNTIGAPEINVTTMAPGNNLVYEAVVALVPKIKKLTDWKNISIKRFEVVVSDKEVKQSLDGLARMQTKEIRATKTEKLGKSDKAVVDLDIKKDGVSIDGGQTKGSFVFMNQESYLPGLPEKIEGMTEDEQKTIQLVFPKEHFQKNLAGAKVDVVVKLKEIFHLETPSVDDAFAESLGFDSLKSLEDKLKENILEEKTNEAELKQEKEILEEIAKKSEFEEMPAKLIEGETDKMLHELQRQVHDYGLEFEQYLSSLKKTVEELKKDFAPQAKRRLEIALLLKEIANAEHVEVGDTELDEFIGSITKDVKDVDARKMALSEEYKEYQRNIMLNRKTIDLLKQIMIK
jgi:trigger factor